MFFYAGAVKASASQEFAFALLPFTFIPSGWTYPLAIALAWSEVLTAILLLLPRFYKIGALVVTFLCLVFISVLAWALLNGIIVSCNCFGGDEAPSATKMLFAIGRDILLLLSAIFLILPNRIRKNT